MKKIRNKSGLFIALTLVMMISAGCGKKTTGSDSTLVIGGIGPLTGDAASYGTSVKQGAEIAIKEINDEGGVKVGDKTMTLSLNFQDDQADPDKALTAYNTLMDEGIDVLMGTVTSGSGLAIMDTTNQDGILQITPSGSAKDLTKYNNCFRLCFTDPFQGETMADYAVNKLGKKKIAVIFDNKSDYSIGMKDAFETKAKQLGGTIVASEAFAGGDVDFATQLTTIKSKGADIIFVPSYYQEAAGIAKQATALKMKLPFIGGDGWDGVLGQVTDPAVVEGSIFMSPFCASVSDPKVKAFVGKYQEKYKGTPDQFAADGYDTVYVIKAAAEKAGTKASADMIKVMPKISVDGLTGTGISFTAEGEPNKGTKFIQIKNGKYALLD